ncbi:membrane integrity-associated transporter subunit PqiC [Hydrogenophaga aromaticivorans]|uniref:PqiC family protein n=1 Tax=Hydrogenophaga aromaticivorans TaxID=2610898 RepID=UPI001B3822E7|nr:ABC-type transport auxiliary lipoprotein family protein [Hydrogenophaga aromaticivorans]MBQ0919244.1 membrane integrity-associated transporter subunit PqiC [Hydrogenophaga aromaticivorans]
MKRRLALTGLAGLGVTPWLLTACARPPVATHWYELRSSPPGPVPAARAGDGALWEVASTVVLPGALDRETLVVASGAASLQPLTGHRWVEPLRDAIPRLLVADLAVLRGPGLVWRAPVPPGVNPARRLRVEIVTLMADTGRQTLRLQARWWLTDSRPNGAAPGLGQADVHIPLADTSVDALAAAHRLALWQLAVRIVESAPV